MKNWKIAMLSGMFCLSIVAGASANQNARPCAEDAARLCKDVQPGQGRVAQCLKQHASELSPECKEQMARSKDGSGL